MLTWWLFDIGPRTDVVTFFFFGSPLFVGFLCVLLSFLFIALEADGLKSTSKKVRKESREGIRTLVCGIPIGIAIFVLGVFAYAIIGVLGLALIIIQVTKALRGAFAKLPEEEGFDDFPSERDYPTPLSRERYS